MHLFQMPLNNKRIHFDGVPLLVPYIGNNVMEFLHHTFKDYPSKCGAGDGPGNLIVPETFYGLRISPVCHIHDTHFEIAPPTWDAFHSCNYCFMLNLLQSIQFLSSSNVLKYLRNHRASTYFNTVDTIGAQVFWKLKKEQGYVLPEGV